jgi:hypothetical protein
MRSKAIDGKAQYRNENQAFWLFAIPLSRYLGAKIGHFFCDDPKCLNGRNCSAGRKFFIFAEYVFLKKCLTPNKKWILIKISNTTTMCSRDRQWYPPT